MVVRSVAQSVPQSVSQSIASGNIIAPLVAGSLAHFDETSIVGATPVTAWNNIGTGGSAFDLDVVVGTGANLTTSVLNGHTGILSTGSAGLETTAGQTINGPATVFMVFKPTPASPPVQMNFMDARSTTAARWVIFTNNTAADKFAMFQGTILTLSEAYDNNLHVFTAQFNNDSSSKLTVSNVGSVTGDAGSAAWDFASIFISELEVTSAQGLFLEFVVYDRALIDAEIIQNQIFLATKHGA